MLRRRSSLASLAHQPARAFMPRLSGSRGAPPGMYEQIENQIELPAEPPPPAGSQYQQHVEPGAGQVIDKPAETAQQLAQIVADFEARRAQLAVPDVELAQAPYSWEAWATNPATTSRALRSSAFFHGAQAGRLVLAGVYGQNNPVNSLTQLLDHAAQLSRLWQIGRERSDASLPDVPVLTVLAGAAQAAAEWLPYALNQAQAEGAADGYAEFARMKARWDAQRGFLNGVVEYARELADKAGDVVKDAAAGAGVGGGVVLALILAAAAYAASR